ncbi:hypothetical protein [Dapis sp. BLCC M172]
MKISTKTRPYYCTIEDETVYYWTECGDRSNCKVIATVTEWKVCGAFRNG